MANGKWSIDPTTGVTTSTTTNGELKLVFDERTTATQVYTVKYTEGDYCGQVTITQEREEPAP